ncbi:MAG: iron-sulfur cluster assembly accessory protein [Bacteroidetes bacterium]|nr:iron-sulfur cluster assembly accessory protein [Bacteroidota bacterium]
MSENFMPVQITEKALEEVRNIMNSKEIPDDYGLRIGIKGTGCGGASHMLGFDHKKDNDMVYLREGIPIYIEKKDVIYLVGLKLDFVDGESSSGFTFAKVQD